MTSRDPKGAVRQFINYFAFVTDSDWSSEQPVSDFSPTVHFKNECLNIHT